MGDTTFVIIQAVSLRLAITVCCQHLPQCGIQSQQSLAYLHDQLMLRAHARLQGDISAKLVRDGVAERISKGSGYEEVRAAMKKVLDDRG